MANSQNEIRGSKAQKEFEFITSNNQNPKKSVNLGKSSSSGSDLDDN